MKRATASRRRASADAASSDVSENAVSRRLLLQVGTLGAAAAGLVASAPNFTNLLAGVTEDAPAVTGVATDAVTIAPSVDGPIIAHITDVSAGNVSIYLGDQEYSFQDHGLVQQLLRQTAR